MEEVEFDSVRQAKELFNQCRILFQKVWVNIKDNLGDNIIEGNKIASGKTLNMNKQKTGTLEDGVGKNYFFIQI